MDDDMTAEESFNEDTQVWKEIVFGNEPEFGTMILYCEVCREVLTQVLPGDTLQDHLFVTGHHQCEVTQEAGS